MAHGLAANRRRAILITALPLAIVIAFGVIGAFAARRASDDGAASATPPAGLPFASEPVQAKWQPRSLGESDFTYKLQPPATDRARSYELTREKILLDGQRDVVIGRSRSNAPDFAFLVNNGSTAERVVIDGLVASECTEYGGYIGGGSDWWIRNSTLHQCTDASQHGLRIAEARNVRISDTVIDTRLADKTSLWVLIGERIELRNVKLLGGRNWFSISPDNPDLPDGRVTQVIIADCWIDLDQDWALALEFMTGVDDVTITNLHVRAARPPIGVWSSLGGAPAAKNVRWKDIWVPAPGQAADKPFDELEWVKLRDDDFERIVAHKGRTREQIIADGVGPLQQPASRSSTSGQ